MQSSTISNINKTRRAICLAAAVTVTLSGHRAALAVEEFQVSTSGATALGAFTRGNRNANSPTSGTLYRGPLAVGTNFTLGTTNYAVPTSGVRYFGVSNPNSLVPGEPNAATQDTLLYHYRESGSIQGILDLADSNGLRASNPTAIRPGDPGANLFLWLNGARFTAPNTTASFGGRSIGSNASATPNGQPLVRIAWSDVRFEQGFAVSGTKSATAAPTQAGYGLGRGNVGGTNFQQLRNASSLVGGIDASTTRLRNEALAIVPFNLVANPGTGLASVTKSDAKWLQATGRLANGANFNSITREIGSGTRNQGANNLGLDPSWAGGERDRRALASYNTFDVNGNAITVNVGDEADPTLSLTGSTTQDPNENRIGPRARFSDKISGSSGVRATVVGSRMGVGILSGGDSRDSSNGTALNDANSSGAPMRALKIDWGNGAGAVQATMRNVVDGTYEMWSASQAVTVAPYANPTANDALAANAYRPISGDQNDQAAGAATSNAQVGVHRKFLDNITKSVASYSGANTEISPTDFIVGSGFIPQQLMRVQKTFDGSAQTASANAVPITAANPTGLTDVDPDGSGPGVSPKQLYLNTASSAGQVLFDNTDWANPSTVSGSIAAPGGAGAVKYRLFASTNNAVSGATANRTIDVSSRTVLAGDFNGDTVRDLNDVPALALAYAAPGTYLATPASGDAAGRNYNGTQVNSISSGANASAADGLIVLSDFNSNGNVTVDANDATFATTAVERSDMKYFLYGATVDTGAQSTDPAVNQNKRENLVRTGQLRKNAAIDTFNASIQSYVTSSLITQMQADALKFDKFDTNGDGVANRLDARYVDRNVGRSYTSFNDVVGTADDLIAAELNDNGAITHIADAGGDSDFKRLATHLKSIGKLVDGDVSLDGLVDSSDLNVVLTNYLTGDHKWTEGDNDFNGLIDSSDLNVVLTNYNSPFIPLGSLVVDLTGFNTDAQLFASLDAFGVEIAAVPEPGTAVLGLIAVAAMAGRRRRRMH
jgi:hypothetical protein